MRLGVDEIADRRLFLEHLAPAHRVDRLLGRVDHHIAVAGLDKARVAAGVIDFGEAVRSDPAHGLPPCSYARSFPHRSARDKAEPAERWFCWRTSATIFAAKLSG